MQFELDREFIIDAVSSFDFELRSIRDTIADSASRRYVDPAKLAERERRLKDMKQLLQTQMAGISISDVTREVRSGYGDGRQI